METALEILKKGVTKSGDTYNPSCVYALLNDKTNALIFLETSLDKQEITASDVIKDKDWSTYLSDKDFRALLVKYGYAFEDKP